MASHSTVSIWQRLRFAGKLTLTVFVLLLMTGTQSVRALDSGQSNIFGKGILYFNNTYCSSDGSTSDSTAAISLVGKDNVEKTMNFLTGKGLTKNQAAGIVGNLMQESGLNPKSVQYGGGPGRGIAQWSVNERWQTVVKLADQQGVSPFTLPVQLQVLWQEATGGEGKGYPTSGGIGYSEIVAAGLLQKSALDSVKSTDDIAKTTAYWEYKFERAGKPEMSNRIGYAKGALAVVGGGDTSTTNTSTTSTTDNGDGTTTQCESTTTSIDCGTNSTSQAASSDAAGGSTRSKVVCIVEHELALWNSKNMKAGHDFFKYSQNADELWCADFMSWAYNQAGYPLANPWRVPAVVTIQAIGEKGGKFQYHDAGSYSPKPGDMIIHLNGQSHVNMVDKVVNGKMTEIGGDQHGSGGADGNIVSSYTISGSKDNIFTSDGITGYVSPTQ